MTWASSQLLDAFLTTTSEKIIPLTAKGVASGSKVFGAAIFRKSDLSVVVIASNHETSSPLLHGEINCIQHFYALPADQRPPPSECIFFATHEPCSLCLSGITWSGFDNHYFLFTYEDTRDAFNIPHDIRIVEEVFKVPTAGEPSEDFAKRPLYNKSNAFWTARSVADLVADLEGDEKQQTEERVKKIKQDYNGLSGVYQGSKGSAGIPLA
ncbi:CMP/dCMP deaminase zinc-binding protein [Kwoniella mangroviensis CBS 8886]|uniref:uncharacterized protein n=1 Tax=Kwoniella mangroviensis CBS 8507 TaxID=1296122 RepID=UPI00080D2737|nr:CMP/dCMP deaminase zinc-binding protein [Kwoniella mangroviensis CBS 8507]OCF69307.1 CMP/dCMP deaminase zinc-binding protein [Kwoniella mangroviensis CBS 8507]OCF72486.1 CMP/dCMP deaminase zinc-binding protein [Kwoniella mangroviensis CBS 8886]